MSDARTTPRPSATSLGALVGLGVATALWSLFLWSQLLLSRSGGTPFCPLGEAATCGALWDASFSRGVHAWTGLPIAAWGVAWGLAAAALPIFVLMTLAESGSAATLVTACRVTAAGGVVGVFVLGGVAASAGLFCGGCFATYILVAGYAGIALFGWQHLGVPDLSRGAAQAFGTLAAVYLVLLYPGRATPASAGEVGRQAVAQSAPATPGAPAAGPAASGSPAASFLASLAPGLRQTLADAMLQHRAGIALPLPQPRALIGEAKAPVRITEFTDVLCDHCAQLHETIGEIERRASGTFNLEPRQFPLDASCNPAVQRSGSPIRCLAAKTQICMEGREGAFEYSGALFAKQKTLTESDVFALAEPHMKRAELEACVASGETKKKLADDVALALRYEPDGTPLVLVNGRKASAFAPFLYALVLTGGRNDDPAFAALPPGNPNAHVH